MWNFTSRFSRFSMFGVCFKTTRKSLCGFLTMWFTRFSLFGVPFKATRKSLCGFRKSRFSRFSLFGVPFKATRKSLCGFRCNITPDVPSGGSSSRGVRLLFSAGGSDFKFTHYRDKSYVVFCRSVLRTRPNHYVESAFQCS